MHLSAVFCIIVTAFVLLQSAHAKKQKPDYTTIKEADCTSDRSQHVATLKNVVCKPYPRIVRLNPRPKYQFFPLKVSVNRCDGHCASHVCTPTKTTMKQVPIKYSGPQISGGEVLKTSCGFVEVEEHVNCKCMCMNKESDCDPDKQVYMEERCACVCRDNDIKKQECEKQMGMLWDDTNCTCSCTDISLECTSGHTWNRKSCSCE